MRQDRSPIEMLKSRMADACGKGSARGELWLGTALFGFRDMEERVENHIRLAESLGHSLVCLPVSHGLASGPDLGYRYYGVGDIKQASELSSIPVAAVLDGPFQQMVNQMGLMQVLSTWISGRQEIAGMYNEICERVMALVEMVMAHPVSALVLADDFASESGPMVRPSDLEALCTPFYSRAVAAARQKGIPVFLHSCGRLERLVPMLKTWGIDGLAAVQSRINDLSAIYDLFGKTIMVMGGIEYESLEEGCLKEGDALGLADLIASLGDDLVLCSSCGLCEARHFTQVQKIYAAVDRLGRG